MSLQAILYARFSSAEQAKGLSLERQLGEGKAFIDRKGWTLEKEIVDRGRSAFSGENRAEGSELFEFEAHVRGGLHRGKVLVVENIDRLSRQGAKAAAQFIWGLNEAGVSVATTHDDHLYAADQTNSDMMEIFSIIIKAELSHEESFKKSERGKFTWQKRHERIRSGDKSKTAIKAPAWINVEGDTYILNDYRSKVLNEIYDLYLDGIGIFKIASILNERREPVWAVRKRDGHGGWHVPYVHRLLTKRAVLGEYVTVGGETLAADYFPQAISAEKFNRVQAQLASKPSTGGHAYKRLSNLLSGLIVCGECKGNAAYENKGTNQIPYVKKNGEKIIYNRKHYERLRCNNARRKHACSNRVLLDYKLVETAILDNLGPLLNSENDLASRNLAAKVKVAEIARQIEVRKTQIDNLLDLGADGSRSVGARIVALEHEIDELEADKIAAQAALDQAFSLPSKRDQIAIVEELRQKISDSNEKERFVARSKVNSALKRLIERIIFSADGTFLVYGYAPDIWLIFDRHGNRVSLYEELPEFVSPAGSRAIPPVSDEVIAAQREFVERFEPE